MCIRDRLRITLLDSLEDLSNNQIDTYTANYSVRDISPPIINTQSSSISTSNVFIILSFSESVYTNDNGTGPLELSDFSLDFSDNGGNATDVTTKASSFQIAYSMGGASIRVYEGDVDNGSYQTTAAYDRSATVISVSLAF